MTDKRRSKEQLKKLREILSDILKEAQFLEIEAVMANVDKGLNIVIAMEEDNDNRRANDKKG